MRKANFTEEQIWTALNQREIEESSADLCQESEEHQDYVLSRSNTAHGFTRR